MGRVAVDRRLPAIRDAARVAYFARSRAPLGARDPLRYRYRGTSRSAARSGWNGDRGGLANADRPSLGPGGLRRRRAGQSRPHGTFRALGFHCPSSWQGSRADGRSTWAHFQSRPRDLAGDAGVQRRATRRLRPSVDRQNVVERESRMSSGTLRVVVIGGGISGLAAAHALVRDANREGRSLRLTVLEASQRLGGNIRTEPLAGFEHRQTEGAPF